MKRFISILQFMTRIPINIDTGFDEEFHKTITYFPLVGLVLGVLIYIIGLVSGIFFDSFITSIIVTLALVILTGGLHIDGLGDTFDAIYSNRDKERILEIMKDSRLGTNSLLAIMFTILIKIGVIVTFLNRGMSYMIAIMPMVSRLVVILLARKTESPRENGMGNVFIGKATIPMIIVGLVYTLILSAGFLYIINGMSVAGMYAPMGCIGIGIVVAAIAMLLIKRSSNKKIGGITGDVLGCGIEVAEVVFILVVYFTAVLLF